MGVYSHAAKLRRNPLGSEVPNIPIWRGFFRLLGARISQAGVSRFEQGLVYMSMSTKKYFAQVLEEIKRDQIDLDLWAMAQARALGGRDQAFSLYVQYRVEELRGAELFGRIRSVTGSAKADVKSALKYLYIFLLAFLGLFWFVMVAVYAVMNYLSPDVRAEKEGVVLISVVLSGCLAAWCVDEPTSFGRAIKFPFKFVGSIFVGVYKYFGVVGLTFLVTACVGVLLWLGYSS